jgi:hypothetical protein
MGTCDCQVALLPLLHNEAADHTNYFDRASDARYLSQVAQGGLHGVRLLPAQTFNGIPVQAVQTDGD